MLLYIFSLYFNSEFTLCSNDFFLINDLLLLSFAAGLKLTGQTTTTQKSKRQAQDLLLSDEPKRAKHSSELLQRLIAPKSSDWQGSSGGKKGSVLMNLLVSGCDVNAGYVCIPINRAGKSCDSSKRQRASC